MNYSQAIHAFWSSFGWATYDENSVPDDAGFPRVTYDVVEAEFDDKATMSANLFNKSTSWGALQEKLDEISTEIGRGGKVIKIDDGAVWITKASPFARRSSESDTIKAIIININAEKIKN